MQPIKIIGISGTNGSGKDTIGHMLAERHGWLDVSLSDILRKEARRRKLPIEREVLRRISAEWRRKYGLGVLVDKAVDQFKKGSYKGVVAIPIRNPGEAQQVKDLGGLLIWVDADSKIRYKRINSRKRSAEDKKTYERFLAEEYEEMHHHGGDEATLNITGVKDICDVFLENNGSDVEAFKDAAEKALKKYL
jgi:dephospho-CoA kinase